MSHVHPFFQRATFRDLRRSLHAAEADLRSLMLRELALRYQRTQATLKDYLAARAFAKVAGTPTERIGLRMARHCYVEARYRQWPLLLSVHGDKQAWALYAAIPRLVIQETLAGMPGTDAARAQQLGVDALAYERYWRRVIDWAYQRLQRLDAHRSPDEIKLAASF